MKQNAEAIRRAKLLSAERELDYIGALVQVAKQGVRSINGYDPHDLIVLVQTGKLP